MSIKRIILPRSHSQNNINEKIRGLVLKKGDTISGKVVGKISQKQVLLQIAGQQISAKIEKALAVGTNASFRVLHTKPEVFLKVIDNQVSTQTKGNELYRGVEKGEAGAKVTQKNHGAPFMQGDIVSGKVVGKISQKHVLLQIAGRQISAKTENVLKVGTDVFFRVDRTRPEVVLKRIDNQASTRSKGNKLSQKVEKGEAVPKATKKNHGISFKQGDIVAGKIVGRISSKQSLLLIGGRQIVARTTKPLPEGTDAYFRVEEIKPDCVLKLMETRPNHIGRTSALSRGISSGRLPIEKLIDFLTPLLGSDSELKKDDVPVEMKKMWDILNLISLNRKVDSGTLRIFLESSGVSWEKKLKMMVMSGLTQKDHVEIQIQEDLKGLALRALSEHATGSIATREVFEKFVEGLQKFQLLNLSGLEDKGKLLFYIPVQLDEGLRIAQLLIELREYKQEKNSEGGDGSVRASVFLDMSRMGPVRVDATIHGKSIMVGFLVTNRDVQKLLDIHRNTLGDSLEKHGFRVQQITCRVTERNTLEETDFMADLVGDERYQFNVVI